MSDSISFHYYSCEVIIRQAKANGAEILAMTKIQIERKRKDRQMATKWIELLMEIG